MSIQDKIAKSILKNHTTVLANHRQADGWWTTLEEYTQESDPVEYKKCTVVFGKEHHARLECQIADEVDLQIQGLQKHASLGVYEGMLFPYPEPRKASFHMGSVQFPIDIIFVGSDGRVTKKVENIEPGTPGKWGMDHVSAVIEANGGFCAAHNIEIGTEVFELDERYAQVDDGDSLPAWHVVTPEESSGANFQVDWFDNPIPGSPEEAMMNSDYMDMSGANDIVLLDDGYWFACWYGNGRIDKYAGPFGSPDEAEAAANQQHQGGWSSQSGEIVDLRGYNGLQRFQESGKGVPQTPATPDPRKLQNKKAQERFPIDPRKDLNPKQVPPNPTRDRFQDRDLVDVQTLSQPMSPQHEEQWGYDPVSLHDDEDLAPVRPSP